MIYPISWAHAAPYLGAAFALAYLLGSIPFGLILTRLAGHRRYPRDRLGQYRRDPTCSGPARSRSPALTLLLDGGKGAAAVMIAMYWGPDIAIVAALGSARRAPVSGLAPLQGRKGRGDRARDPARPVLAGRPAGLPHLAGGRRDRPLLLAVRARGVRACPGSWLWQFARSAEDGVLHPGGGCWSGCATRETSAGC